MKTAPPPPAAAVSPPRRGGAIMVVVAGGLMVLLLFASIALDVGYMHLTRARAEAAARAAARAGYEKLKQLDFDFSQQSQTTVKATMRDYLAQNAATADEAAAAELSVDRRGGISVVLRRASPLYFARLSDAFEGETQTAVAGSVALDSNKIAPFAVPTTYHDPDQNGYSNWLIGSELIDVATPPWNWRVDKPYIIKFGRDSGQPGTSADWIFIPMDDQAHTVTLPSGGFRLPAQDFSGSLVSTPYNISQNAAGRANLPASRIGVIRAYGVAYDAVASQDASVFWVLGYDGGAFLIRKDDLLAAGYTLSGETSTGEGSFQVTIRKDGSSTDVRALNLRSSASAPGTRQLDIEFLQRLDLLTLTEKIQLLRIPKQPKVLTFTESNDPVTCSMINAGIPFYATFFQGDTTSFHDFSIDDSQPAATILNRLRDPGGVRGGPFDWLHLHHENFAAKTGSTRFSHQNLVEAIHRFVTDEHRFIFGACWAAETLEMALAKLGSPNWTADRGVPVLHVDDHDKDEDTQKIEYGKTFAFQDFFMVKDTYHGTEDRESRGGATYGCGAGDCFDDESEIDNEFDYDHVVYLDYKNPLLQNHGGFGGLELDEATEQVSTSYDSSDYIRPQLGATDSFRYLGDPGLHCPENDPAQPDPQYNWSNRDIEEDEPYSDESGDDRQWVNESLIGPLGCDINGNGVMDYVRIRDLPDHRCPCGPLNFGDPHGAVSGSSTRVLDLNCDGTFTNTVTETETETTCRSSNPPSGPCCRFRRGRCRRWRRTETTTTTTTVPQRYPGARLDENDGVELCIPAHDHVILKPHAAAQDGKTTAQEITGGAETAMVLSRNVVSAPRDLSTITYMRYLSGTGDNDGNLDNGFGRWSYLGGHWPGRVNGKGLLFANNNHHSGSDGEFGIAGMRTYLNNILFGSTAGVNPGGAFTPGTGAVNPAGLNLGGGGGNFGAGGFTGNSFRTMFRVGTQGIGLPVGAKFSTAPGNFEAQVNEGLDRAFDDGSGTADSDTWTEFLAWRAGKTPAEIADHPQVFTIPVVERIPGPITDNPTPPDELDDYLLPGSSPSDGANTDRPLSMYAGDPTFAEDDPRQARDLHVTGFAEFFLIDPANQDPDTQDGSIGGHFVTTSWKDGEIRGYFLRDVVASPPGVVFPPSAIPDPR